MKRVIALLTAAAISFMTSGCAVFNRLKGDYEESAAEMTEGVSAPAAEITNDISLGIIDFDTFNPLLTTSQPVKECMQLVYEPLFDVDEKLRPIPVLAESYTVSPDGRTIDIQLRQGVMWHDGTAFTSRDAAYTMKQIRSGITTYTENLANVADYTGIDDDKLRITLNYAVPNFVSLLHFPIVKYQSDMTVNPNFIPVGTGAFMYNSQPSNDTLLFVAYEGHHGGRANIDSVRVQMIPDMQKYETMFEASEIDIITGSTVALAEYTPRGSVRNNEYITDYMTYICFNTQKPVLKDARTRRGISKLIDKESIVNSTIYSRGVAVNVPINPSSIYYYDTTNRFRRDEISAFSLLGDDGWGENANGDYVRMSDGEPQIMELTMLTNSDSVEKTSIAEKVVNELNGMGIKTELIALPYEEYRNRIATMDYDMAIDEYLVPPNGDLSMLISSAGNTLGYANTSLDTLVGQMGMTRDEEQLKELYRLYGDGITEDMPFIPLFFRKSSVLSGAKLKTDIAPSVTRQYRNIEGWRVK